MGILIEPNGSYPDQALTPLAIKAWNQFFTVAHGACDVAHCLISGDSATVKLSVRDSSLDESDPEWDDLAESILIQVDGIIERLDAIPYPDPRLDDEQAAFRAWAEKGIREAFESESVSQEYGRFNPDGRDFAIVTSEYDSGLGETELSLLWIHDPSFTVARIKSRQEAAAGKKRE